MQENTYNTQPGAFGLPEDLEDENGGPLPAAPVKIDYRSKDMELYNKWAQTKSKKDMSKLMTQLMPIVNRQVSRVSGSLPTAALQGEAMHWAVKGIETFDPSKGFALSTHITNYIQRVHRLNYKYQNAVRLPEDMQREYSQYNRALEQLRDEMNSEPTSEDIAKRVGWPTKKVDRFKERLFTEHIESKEEHPSQVSEYSDENILLNHILSHLTDEEKTILKYKGKINSTELAAKLGVNTNRLNYLQSNLRKKIQTMKLGLGI